MSSPRRPDHRRARIQSRRRLLPRRPAPMTRQMPPLRRRQSPWRLPPHRPAPRLPPSLRLPSTKTRTTPRPAKANRRRTQIPPKWRHHRRWLPQLQPQRPSPRPRRASAAENTPRGQGEPATTQIPPKWRHHRRWLPRPERPSRGRATRTRTTRRLPENRRRWTPMPRKCNHRRRRLLLLLRRPRRPDPRHAPARSARRTTDPATGPPTTGRRVSGRSPRPRPPIRSTTPRSTSTAASVILRPHPAGAAPGSGCSSPAWSPY